MEEKLSKTNFNIPSSAQATESGTSTDNQKEGECLALIVDDNRDAANVLAIALKYFGCHTAVAYDGTSGLATFNSLRPAFVFLDIGMPDVSGYDVAKSIRETEAGNRPAVLVAVTGYGQESDKRKSREAGFDYHLTKPVHLTSIEDVLRQAQ